MAKPSHVISLQIRIIRNIVVTRTPFTDILDSSSTNQGERLTGAISAVKARAPVLGGNFGVWGGMFSTFDCAVKGYRQKEDPWNAIIAGFLTGGGLALRGGPRTAFGSAVGCAILLGVFEGEWRDN